VFDALMKRVNAGELTSADAFGTREFLKNNYPYRFIGAKLGIFGNSRDEAFYIPYFVDADKSRSMPLIAAMSRALRRASYLRPRFLVRYDV
jgi:hypothetical protein